MRKKFVKRNPVTMATKVSAMRSSAFRLLWLLVAMVTGDLKNEGKIVRKNRPVRNFYNLILLTF